MLLCLIDRQNTGAFLDIFLCVGSWNSREHLYIRTSNILRTRFRCFAACPECVRCGWQVRLIVGFIQKKHTYAIVYNICTTYPFGFHESRRRHRSVLPLVLVDKFRTNSLRFRARVFQFDSNNNVCFWYTGVCSRNLATQFGAFCV